MAVGVLPELEKMLEKYYQLKGWDENGVTTEEKLRELGRSANGKF